MPLEWATGAGCCERLGTISRDSRGRARINLGRGHRYANKAGWQYLARYVVMEALGRRLRSDEHVNHVHLRFDQEGADELHNLAVVHAWFHGRLHAWALDVAGLRDKGGRFVEFDEPWWPPKKWPRFGPILGPAALTEEMRRARKGAAA